METERLLYDYKLFENAEASHNIALLFFLKAISSLIMKVFKNLSYNLVMQAAQSSNLNILFITLFSL